MKLPRDLSASDLVKALGRIGYVVTRQKGDHVYMTTREHGEHHVAVPLHKSINVGTLAAILASVASHRGVMRDDLVREMKI
jgi:predicted RNA binding protein YcfA (HicA-like mRNA interferase family)